MRDFDCTLPITRLRWTGDIGGEPPAVVGCLCVGVGEVLGEEDWTI